MTVASTLKPQNKASAGAVTSDVFYSMANYVKATIYCTAVMGGDSAEVACQALEATSAAGSNAANITGKTATLSGDTGDVDSDSIVVLESDLSDDTNYLGVKMTPTEDNTVVSAVIVFEHERYLS